MECKGNELVNVRGVNCMGCKRSEVCECVCVCVCVSVKPILNTILQCFMKLHGASRTSVARTNMLLQHYEANSHYWDCGHMSMNSLRCI